MAETTANKILLVDDDEDVLKYLTSVLRRCEYNVLATTKGQEALELARKETPNLIILDLILPDIDGGDVAYTLSEDPATANIPIIFLTGIVTKSEEATGLKSGKRVVIAKPVTQEGLLNAIKQALAT